MRIHVWIIRHACTNVNVQLAECKTVVQKNSVRLLE